MNEIEMGTNENGHQIPIVDKGQIENTQSNENEKIEIESNLNEAQTIKSKPNEEVPTDEETDQDEEDGLSYDEKKSLIKISSYSINEFRSIKKEIEEAIIKKIKNMENITKPIEDEKYVCYFSNYSIDKIGNLVINGETGVAEGWNVPIYENEFQNLLGLPFHEDNALAETLRIKRPRLECFNCLASHRVQDCPIKMNDERINIHRKIFTTQSMQAQGQADLFSCRYTSDLDSKVNRGFTPGKISDQLKQALGIKTNQLPPYVYLMRELGYPIGWLIEAQVKQPKLAVHDGDKLDGSGADKDKETELIEYDPDKIYSFPGFNQALPPGVVDEYDRYNVERYEEKNSPEKSSCLL